VRSALVVPRKDPLHRPDADRQWVSSPSSVRPGRVLSDSDPDPEDKIRKARARSSGGLSQGSQQRYLGMGWDKPAHDGWEEAIRSDRTPLRRRSARPAGQIRLGTLTPTRPRNAPTTSAT
jgi:hypothetical protein